MFPLKYAMESTRRIKQGRLSMSTASCFGRICNKAKSCIDRMRARTLHYFVPIQSLRDNVGVQGQYRGWFVISHVYLTNIYEPIIKYFCLITWCFPTSQITLMRRSLVSFWRTFEHWLIDDVNGQTYKVETFHSQICHDLSYLYTCFISLLCCTILEWGSYWDYWTPYVHMILKKRKSKPFWEQLQTW